MRDRSGAQDYQSDYFKVITEEEFDMFNQSTARELEIESERIAMKDAMDEIAELLYNDEVDKSQLAELILPFIGESYLSNIAILASEHEQYNLDGMYKEDLINNE